MEASSLGTIPWDPQYLQRLRLWDFASRPGSANRQLLPNDTYRDQYHRPGVLSQKYGIRRGVLDDDHDNGG